MEKLYKANEELKKYYEYNVTNMKVPAKFKGILVDILMRRAYEYKLTSAEIQQDMSSLISNLKSIKIVKMPEAYKELAGLYNYVDNEIILSSEYIDENVKNNNYEAIYITLTHEVFHALSCDENGNDRLGTENKFSKDRDRSLLEAIVEKAADRCIYNRGKFDPNSPYFHQNKDGYADITFVTDALAATYGVTEQGFLRAAIMGRERLEEFLSDVSKESKEDSKGFLDGIQLSFAKIHNTLYNTSWDKRKNANIESAEMIEAISSMYRVCEWKMQARLEKLDITSIEQARYIEQYSKYNHNKLFLVMDRAAKEFEKKYGTFGKDITQKFYESTEEQRNITVLRISEMSQLVENVDKIPSTEEALKLINLAKSGKLSDEDRQKISDYGIDIQPPKDNIFSISKEFLQERMSFDFSNEDWNNQEICEELKNVFSKSRIKRFANSIKYLFSSAKDIGGNALKLMTGEPTLMLGVGEYKENEELNEQNTNCFGELSPEQLSEFRKGEAEAIKQHNILINNECNREKGLDAEEKSVDD